VMDVQPLTAIDEPRPLNSNESVMRIEP
jgi:hypothetical protein